MELLTSYKLLVLAVCYMFPGAVGVSLSKSASGIFYAPVGQTLLTSRGLSGLRLQASRAGIDGVDRGL